MTTRDFELSAEDVRRLIPALDHVLCVAGDCALEEDSHPIQTIDSVLMARMRAYARDVFVETDRRR